MRLWRPFLFIIPIMLFILLTMNADVAQLVDAESVWIAIDPQPNTRFIPQYEQGTHHTSHAAILFERTSGTVLFGTDIHERRAPASTTKIMTALLAIELGHMDDIVQVSRYAAGITGSSAGLYVDQRLALLDLMHGMLLNSGNDAAVAVAEHIAGTEERFVALMNERAQQLGLHNTHFRNPHGLDEPDHYSTPYDMALLTDTAMHHALFAEIVAKKEYSYVHGTFRNTNRLLWSMDGATGVKTGTTGQAGYCLVAAVNREGMELIGIVLGSSNRWNDAMRLLNYGFDNFQRLTVFEAATVMSELNVPNMMRPLPVMIDRDVSVVRSEERRVGR